MAKVGKCFEENCAAATASPPSTGGMGWPSLASLGLDEVQRAARRDGVGGSDANIILSGRGDRIDALWRIKRSEQDDEDLSDNLAVMLGCWSEPFNRAWYEQNTGLLVGDAGATFTAGDLPWRRATVDGIVEARGSVWEAKHVNAFAKPDEVLARYMPQLQHNMAVTGLEHATLSVIYGNHRWETYEVASDWLYQDALLAAETRFWNCVQSGEEPVAVPSPPPPKPDATREVSFEGNNSWAIAAWDWLDSFEASRTHAAATTSLKALIEDDVTRAHGHGIEAKRSRAGAISIRKLAS